MDTNKEKKVKISVAYIESKKYGKFWIDPKTNFLYTFTKPYDIAGKFEIDRIIPVKTKN